MEQYRKKYNSYIETPVVDISEMDFDSGNELVFPNKSQIFVPRSFRALTYKKNIHLEDRDTWGMCEEREDIGKFVGEIMRHQMVVYGVIMQE